jgi:hypothetical protein
MELQRVSLIAQGVFRKGILSLHYSVLVIEALSKMVNVTIKHGLLTRFSLGERGYSNLVISHSLFANDTLIFCEANPEQIRYVRLILLCFEAVLGLRVNLGKFEIIAIGGAEDIEELANILGCSIVVLPIKYLGLPLGASYMDKAMWTGVIVQLECRLPEWIRLYLSKGGRLIKSTLSSIPTYFLSLFHVPMSVANRIEKVQRDFLWGGMGGEPKMHLVNWNQVCHPIQEGSLGIRVVHKFNQALLGKWMALEICD